MSSRSMVGSRRSTSLRSTSLTERREKSVESQIIRASIHIICKMQLCMCTLMEGLVSSVTVQCDL